MWDDKYEFHFFISTFEKITECASPIEGTMNIHQFRDTYCHSTYWATWLFNWLSLVKCVIFVCCLPGCLYDRWERANGEVWDDVSDSCSVCTCHEGSVRCEKNQCPPSNCRYPVQRKCCMACDGKRWTERRGKVCFAVCSLQQPCRRGVRLMNPTSCRCGSSRGQAAVLSFSTGWSQRPLILCLFYSTLTYFNVDVLIRHSQTICAYLLFLLLLLYLAESKETEEFFVTALEV